MNPRAGDSTSTPFEPHAVSWDAVKVKRYWDFLEANPVSQEIYWSRQVGPALLRYTERLRPLGGHILDFGCGPGFLLDHLLRKPAGKTVWGVDFSPSSIQSACRRLDGRPGFGGASEITHIPTTLEERFFDVVFFVETLEHVLPDSIDAYVGELRRILRSGGILIVTTPNSESLQASAMFCPDCGATFHPRQHVTSWTAQSLRDRMEGQGFRTIRCEARRFVPRLISTDSLRLVRDRLRARRPPHLVYVGERR